ncbi:type 2 lanthipeptide synthetase LanM family protein (plasmid) [Bacillus thuringiensis]|uniref:type 2 lanthipeptide synthetase LanM family protein n=1 Tax=Bacillus thuringiensis TaxID=1428 RepID=UPI0039774E5C
MTNNLETNELEITFDDVINYWMTLFPEITDKKDLEKLLLISDTSFKELEKKYNEESLTNVDINRFFEVKIDKRVEKVFDKLIDDLPWAHFFKPIVNYYAKDLYRFLTTTPIIEDTDNLFEQIIGGMVQRLDQISYKVLILETNIARLENKLVGNSSQEKALYFRNVLLNDASFVQALYREYQELSNIMDFKVKHTFDYMQEIIKDTTNQWDHLSKIFTKENNLGKLREITLGAGDTHNGGKSVSILKFSCGKNVVYKPRDLQLEKGFYDFIQWINQQERENSLDLRAAKVHFIEHAGWVECIEYKTCETSEQIKRFYYRTGQLLGILYAVNGKDFHYENIIAQGEYPILIDLETFLHPDLHTVDKNNASASMIANEIISSSVDGIGLLPSPIINNKTNKSVDVGGVGAEEVQVSPFKSTFIADIDSDQVRITKDYGLLGTQKNNPNLNGIVLKSKDYLEQTKNGFIDTYRWILKNKDLFISKVVELFDQKECRVLFRSTYIYAQLLTTSYHPDLLRNPLDRKVYLHRLALILTDEFKDIGLSEIYDMQQGDVPLFTSTTSQNKIYNGRKQHIVGPKIVRSPIETIKWKVGKLSEEDLERQLNFIDITYLTKSNDSSKDITNLKLQEHSDSEITQNEREKWLNLAIEIGDHLLDKSIIGKYDGKIDRTWIGSFSADKESTTTYLTQVGQDLYGGNSGIALFLAHLGFITNSQRYKEATYEAILPVIQSVELFEGTTNVGIGAFTGISGQIYAIFQIGHLFKDNQLIKLAQEKILLLEKIINPKTIHDVIGGIAGTMAVALSMYENSTDNIIKKDLINLANHCFNTLKESTVQFNERDGITWGEEGYTGFSHGNAGITAYLAKLYNITKNAEILPIIEESLKYEKTLYCEETNNWYNSIEKENRAYGWCHGAPSILLNRVMLYQYKCCNELANRDLQIALETTKNDGLGRNPSLCHGDLGNLRILHFASTVLEDKILQNQCIATFDELYTSFLQHKWDKGVFRGTENYGLMVGLSGFGYTCLQFYAPEVVKDILWLN